MKFECAFDELLDINDPKLIPNPKNNNKHPKEQIERLSKIISYQGQRSPIVISKRSGFLVKGHARLEAIKALGWQQIAVNWQSYESEAQEYADMTADNAIASWANVDLSEVNAALVDLGPDFDLETLGLKNFAIEPFDLPEYGEKNKEIETDGFGDDLKHTCPKCGFDFND